MAVCQQEDLIIRRFELLYQKRYEKLARLIIGDIRAVSPETEIHPTQIEFDDPWDGFVHFMENTARLHATDRSVKEILIGTRDHRRRVRRARAKVAPLVALLVQRAQAGGQLRGDIEVLDMPLMQFVLGAFTDLETPGDPELWRRYLGILLDGLRTPDPHPLPGRPPTPDEFDKTFASVRRR